MINKVKIIKLPKKEDARGNLSFIEEDKHVPFKINRVYWIYDVPGGEKRGGHAHKGLQQLIIAVSGAFDVLLDDGINQKVIRLDRPFIGLHIVPGIWRELFNFSSGSFCPVLASRKYNKKDYIRIMKNF